MHSGAVAYGCRSLAQLVSLCAFCEELEEVIRSAKRSITSSFLLLVVMPGATRDVLLLVAMPFVTSSFLFYQAIQSPKSREERFFTLSCPFVSSRDGHVHRQPLAHG